MTPADRRTLVYLVRHGQTPLNESGVLRGLTDIARRAHGGMVVVVSHDATRPPTVASHGGGPGERSGLATSPYGE